MFESLPLELVREDSTAVTVGAEENKLTAGDHSLAV